MECSTLNEPATKFVAGPSRRSNIASFQLLADHFRSSPNNGHRQTAPACLKGANKRLVHRNNLATYSITSSARTSTDGEIINPSALAALLWIISSSLVGN